MKEKIKVIAFDADDTLWKNEDYYRDAEYRFADILKEYGEKDDLIKALFDTEMQNLKILGYGVKSFIISMVETAIEVSEHQVSIDVLAEIVRFGKEILLKPIELLPNVKEVLEALHGSYRLIVATKGDLLDQEQKLIRSSLSKYFHHIEIMSDKNIESYRKLLSHLEVAPEEFIMIGNSLRSDILPPYELGCYTIQVPYELTWQHESNVEELPENERFHRVEKLEEVLPYLV